MIHAAAWVPWVFAGVEGCLARSERRCWMAVATLAVAMTCLAGHMQIAFYGLVASAAYLAWRLPASLRADRLRPWLVAVGSVVLGLLLAAPQLLTTARYVRETPRALLDYESFTAFSLPPRQLPTLIVPWLFGGTWRQLGTAYFGADNFNELCLYLPFLTLALAVPGALFHRRGIAGFWVATTIVAMLLALGGSLPPLAALAYRVPGFDQFRVPARHLMEVALAGSVLAAFGVDWVRTGPTRSVARFAAGVAVVAVVTIAAIVPLHHVAEAAARAARTAYPAWSRDPAVGVAATAIVLAPIAIAALARRRAMGLVVFGVCAAVGVGSFAWFADWRLTPTGGAPAATPLERDVAARIAAEGGRVLHAEGGWAAPFTTGRTRKLGIPSVNWYGPLLPIRARDLLRTNTNGIVAPETLHQDDVALDLYGVRFVAIGAAPTPENRAKVAMLAPPRWQPIGRETDTRVLFK
jgi:hypothetical protein